ncbi:MAG TPA: tetratricopeptide repeat protein [Acidobacteriaceae bacterium]
MNGCIRASRLAIVAALWLCAVVARGQTTEELAQRGRAALEAGQYAEAEQAYGALVRQEPNIAEMHVTLGMVYFKEGKFDLSIKELRRALELNPQLPRVDSLLAMALSERGEYREAVPGLEKGFHQTADKELRRMCGLRLERAYTSLHSDTKAVQTALDLRQLYPDDPEVLYYSSKVFGNSAFLTAQKLFEVAPQSMWGLMAAGEAHESQGDTDAAVRDYEAVLKKDPARPNVHFRIGRTLLVRAEGKSDEADVMRAADEFRAELGIDPANANAAYELGELYRKQGDAAAGRKYFEQAVASYPSFEEAHVGLAATLVTLSELAPAQEHLQKAVELNPEDSVAWYRLAQVDRKLGKSDEQQKALAQFAHLRQQRTAAQSNAEVTPQRLDATEAP